MTDEQIGDLLLRMEQAKKEGKTTLSYTDADGEERTILISEDQESMKPPMADSPQGKQRPYVRVMDERGCWTAFLDDEEAVADLPQDVKDMIELIRTKYMGKEEK